MYEEQLVSVIIPIYNVAPYLERCVNSIIRQTYTNLEIILIDDGSIDESGDICDRLKLIDSRIVVVHQKNIGLAGARNTGLDICKGKYICFVDSDDYVHHDYVKYLYKMCQENDCEIGICYHYITEDDDYYKDIDINSEIEIYSRKEIFERFYTKDHGSIVIAWNKIYRRDCIGSIRFDVGMIHEDEATTFKFLYNAKKIAFGREVLYYYYSRSDSITGQAYNIKKLDILKAYENRLVFYREHNEKELYDRECQYYLSEILANYYKVWYQLNKDELVLTTLREKYLKIYTVSEKSDWSLCRKVMYKICITWPMLYGYIKHII